MCVCGAMDVLKNVKTRIKENAKEMVVNPGPTSKCADKEREIDDLVAELKEIHRQTDTQTDPTTVTLAAHACRGLTRATRRSIDVFYLAILYYYTSVVLVDCDYLLPEIQSFCK